MHDLRDYWIREGKKLLQIGKQKVMEGWERLLKGFLEPSSEKLLGRS